MCGGDPGNFSDALKKDAMGTGGLSIGLYSTRKANNKITEEARDNGILPKKKTPGDPAAERAAAEADAATKANIRIAFQRRAMRENSLLTGGGQAAAGAGRSTLGV